MEDEILLNISTKKDRKRPKIMIDDKLYELAVPDDFKLKELISIVDAGEKAAGLLSGGNENAGKDAQKLLDQIARKILRRIPNRVYRRLDEIQKLDVLQAFTKVVEKLGKDPRQAGTKSFPGSSASMAELSKAGKIPS